MLLRNERLLLAGVWVSIVASSAIGVLWVTGRPVAEPAASSAGAGPVPPPPPSPDRSRGLIRLQEAYRAVTPSRPPVTPYVGCMIPEMVLIEKPGPAPRELLLPTALYSGKVDMSRATLTWTLQSPVIDRQKKPEQAASKIDAVVIRRTCDEGEIEEIAVLDPKVTTFEDRSLEPGRTYSYSVVVRGMEGLYVYPDRPPVVDKDGQGSVEGTVPAWHRVKLVGGGLEQAFLSVESYNPETGKWDAKLTKAAPGQKIGATGWTLGKMRFDRFTLVAEVTDDRFVKREISTKKD